nr:putative ribonuclease H-like domain-containing protein [Tanacetum cinerariifolium]
MKSLSPQVVSAAKLPILNPNEFDIWKMRIEQLARKNELKARGTLLMALPDKHQLKFNIHKDAKTLMEAIEKRFGGNKETKKLEILGEYLSLEDINLKFLRSIPTEWKTHTLIWMNKTVLEEQSLDDLFNNLKIYEAEVKSSSSASTSIQNIAFVSSSNTDSTNEPISAAASVFTVSAKLTVSALLNIDADDLEEMDLKWKMAMLTVKARRFFQRTGRNLGANGPTSMGFDMNDAAEPQRRNVLVETSTSNALVLQCDGVGSYDWSFQAEEEPTNYALMAFTSSSSSSDNEPTEQVKSPRPFVKHVETSILTANPKTAIPKPTSNGNRKNRKACFVCQSLDHLIKVCDYHEKKLAQTSPRNHAPRGYHQHYARMPLPNPLRHVIPTTIILKSKLVPINGARPVTAAVPKTHVTRPRPAQPIVTKHNSLSRRHVNRSPSFTVSNFPPKVTAVKAPMVNAAKGVQGKWEWKPKCPILDHIAIPKPTSNGKRRNKKACFVCKSLDHLIKDCDYHEKKLAPTTARPVTTAVPKTSVTRPRQAKIVVTKTNSPPRRHIKRSPSPKASTFPLKVTAVKAPIVNAAQGGKPQHAALKDKGVIDSGCSRHMTWNMSYLFEFEELNGGYVAFGGNPNGGKISRKGKIRTEKLDFDDVYFVKELKFNLFSVSQMCDKKNNVLFTDTKCLVLSLEFKLPDENQVLLRVPRENNIYNVDLKNIVPSGDLTCLFAKATLDESNLWHRRLGHINFKIMNKLVKGNLVRGLPTKVFENDNTCVSYKKGKQHRASYKTKPVSSVNQSLYRLHMDLFRPTFVKSMNKKSYCLVVTYDYSRTPSIGFMRPFGCLVTILNTLDSLGKFDGKVDEEFLVGYSVSSKAYRVFNSRTRIVQETLHVNFLENKPNVPGSGPTWLFDIDTLTKTMNYQPVTAGNQSNRNAGVQEQFDAEKVGDENDQQYVFFRVWSSGSTNPQNTDGDASFDVKEPEFEGRKPESEVIVSPSSNAQSKKHNDKTKIEAQGKSLVESLTRYRNLSAEFEDFYDNSVKEDNAAGTLVFAVGQISPNSTNSFSAAGPLNVVASPTHGKSSCIDISQYPDDLNMPELEDITYSDEEDDVGAEADFTNLETSITVSPIPITRVHKDHHATQILGDLSSATQTRNMTREKGINYEEVFALVARIEAIRLFLAYASFMGIDVKSAFLYGAIKEEVYVCQPLGFEDPDYPEKVDKVVKALYGLHQAPRAWKKGDILLVQIYVDDIIFGSTNKDLCKAFENLMKDKFQMSSMGKLTFFLGLQVKQKKDGIFISQDKYIAEILRNFGLIDRKLASTPIDTEKPLLKDPDVDVHTYTSMIGSLMYLTSSRLDIMFAPFWTTVVVKKVNDITRLQALVDKKKVVVTKATIRDALHLDDAEGVECLPNEEIFTELARMGYEKPSTKLTFYKAFFSSQWNFLIHTILECMSAKRTSWNEFSSSMASAVICLSTGKGFSGVDTPLFEGMLVAQEVGEDADEVHAEDVNAAGVIAESDASDDVNAGVAKPSIPSPTPPTPPPQPSQDIPSTSQIDANKDVVLEDAKDVAVEKSGDVEDNADIQERTAESQAQIYQIDLEHANKVLIVTATSTTITVVDVLIPALKTTAAPTLTAAPSRRRKEVVIRDPEKTTTTSTVIHSEAKSKDKGKRILVEEPKPLKKQAQIKQDEKYARELEAENVAGFKMDYFKGMTYDDIRPVFEKYFDSNVAFLQKTKEQMDEEDSRALKRLNESQKEKAAKKEDLEALWRLVTKRFATTKPKNFSDDFLLITLGAMFEKPDIHAQI